MIEKITPAQIAENQQHRIFIDVRTPAEYEQGHIVGAVNMPLFTNDERAIVGKIYKKDSPDKALLKGLDLVGQKLPQFVRKATKLAPEKRIALYCWRGGKRSGSMAWLLDLAGFDVQVIIGGYKAYRTEVQTHLENLKVDFRVIGGKTGTGKTEVLHHLRDMGEQVLDLEGLANHKGSAFGALGENPQPSNEHFENLLYNTLQKADVNRPIWIENESRNVGKCFIPLGVWTNFKGGVLINIEIPDALRLERSVKDYAQYSIEDLINIFKRIERKIGGQHAQAAIDALEKKQFHVAAEVALVYYDKTYQHGLDQNETKDIRRIQFDHADMLQIAHALKKEFTQ